MPSGIRSRERVAVGLWVSPSPDCLVRACPAVARPATGRTVFHRIIIIRTVVYRARGLFFARAPLPPAPNSYTVITFIYTFFHPCLITMVSTFCFYAERFVHPPCTHKKRAQRINEQDKVENCSDRDVAYVRLFSIEEAIRRDVRRAY